MDIRIPRRALLEWRGGFGRPYPPVPGICGRAPAQVVAGGRRAQLGTRPAGGGKWGAGRRGLAATRRIACPQSR